MKAIINSLKRTHWHKASVGFLTCLLLLIFPSCQKDEHNQDSILNPDGMSSSALSKKDKLKQGEVMDVEGNVYKTVKIGKQWWMAENLAYLPEVSPPTDGSEIYPYYYVYGYDGSDVTKAKATPNYETYGVLYNWPALMGGAASSSTNPSGVQGVCPTGWHVPSDAEWHTLVFNLDPDAEIVLGPINWSEIESEIAGGKLKETGFAHWTSPNTGATNESGFTALPGGNRSGGGYIGDLGTGGGWWSATERIATHARGRYLGFNYSTVYSFNDGKVRGFSVRCVKDK